MCGAPLVKDGKNSCATSVQTEHVEQQKVAIPSLDENSTANKKTCDYFSFASHNNSEEYINIGKCLDYSGLVYILSDLIDDTFIFSKRRTGQSKKDNSFASKAAENKRPTDNPSEQ